MNKPQWTRAWRDIGNNPSGRRFLKEQRSRQERRETREALAKGEEPAPPRPSNAYTVS